MDKYTNVILNNYGGGLFECVIARFLIHGLHCPVVARATSQIFFCPFHFHCDFLLYIYVIEIK